MGYSLTCSQWVVATLLFTVLTRFPFGSGLTSVVLGMKLRD